ncbi:MAG: thymidine kinase [Enterococcus sp.]|nr:thymidine kinase [Enterococcus sp.]
MAKLYFRYGAMNSGKSTNILQVAHNYKERGQIAIIAKPTIDTKDEKVLSRLGIAHQVDIPVAPETDMLRAFRDEYANTAVDCLIVDEAQFLTREQINDLLVIAVQDNVPVIAYGLRSDFQGRGFEGSLRLMEIAHSLEELKTICRCGKKAMFNGRRVNGVYVRSGDQVAIDDGGEVEYESLCAKCYMENVGPLV